MTTPRLPANVAVAAAIPALDDAGAPVQRIKLLPVGAIVLRDGRGPYRIADRAAADKVVAASLAVAGGTDLPIDYDHALVYAAPEGRPAPASGWARGLEAADDGIYATVEWTAAAATALAARAYRYISPVFTHDKAGNVLTVSCAGLTNFPAITDLPAIAAAATLETDSMKTIAAALGLAESADEPTIVAAIATLKAASTATAAAAVKLGLAADATIGMVAAAAIAAATPDPAKWVPIAVLDEINAKFAVVNAERAENAVAAASRAGKIVPAQKEWATGFFLKSEVEFNDWLAKAPVVVAAGAMMDGDPPPPTDDNGLTADEANACRMTGTKPASFLAAKKKKG